MYASVVVILLLGATSAFFGAYGWALMWLVVWSMVALYMALVKDRVLFATMLLSTSVTVLWKYPACIALSFAGLIVQVCWLYVWITTYINAWPYFGHNPIVVLLMVISLFWTSQVISNVVQVAVAGTAASWYFLYDHMPARPTARALCRTLTAVRRLPAPRAVIAAYSLNN